MRSCPACGSPRCTDAWLCEACGNRPEAIGGFTSFAPALAAGSAGFREDYFSELAAIESDNFWFLARNELIVWAMRTHLADLGSFLEIGCGTGFVLAGIRDAFPLAALTGSEIFTTGLGFAARRVPSATFLQMDAQAIPFREEFDAVGAFDVLEHIDDDGAVLRQVTQALRPGGRDFVATVPQHPSLWSAQDDHAFHVRRYTATQLRRPGSSAGVRGRADDVVRVVAAADDVRVPFAHQRQRCR